MGSPFLKRDRCGEERRLLPLKEFSCILHFNSELLLLRQNLPSFCLPWGSLLSESHASRYHRHHWPSQALLRILMLLHSDMGFSEEETAEGMPRAVAGILLRTPLRPISTKPSKSGAAADDEECSSATTPTAEEARIPEKLPCPPAPKKRKPPLRCQMSGDFFIPPDLETVFIRRPERAKLKGYANWVTPSTSLFLSNALTHYISKALIGRHLL